MQYIAPPVILRKVTGVKFSNANDKVQRRKVQGTEEFKEEMENVSRRSGISRVVSEICEQKLKELCNAAALRCEAFIFQTWDHHYLFQERF